MKIRWLAKAIQNLEGEAEHIAKDNPSAAQALVKRIHEAVNRLQIHPAIGRPGRIEGTRELVIPGTPYIIPYRVNIRLNQIEVLRVFHGSRRYPSNW